MAESSIKKAVRSTLFQAPRLYAALTSEWRYVLLHRLGRVHERDFRAFPLITGKADPLVLDVGANIGQSVLSIKTVLPRARIISFEPNPANWPALDRMARRFPDFTYERYGLSDADGEAELLYPVYNGKVMGALASFNHDTAGGFLNPGTVYGFRPELLELRRATLATRRLDDLGLAPDIVKMDVEGYEEHVVRGGLETFSKHRPALMIEAPSGPLRKTLADLDYVAMEYVHPVLGPSAGARVNQIFIPV